MATPRNVNINLDSVQDVRSVRRAGGWVPAQSTTTGKMLIAVTSIILVGGIAAAVAVPFITAAAKAARENIETTILRPLRHRLQPQLQQQPQLHLRQLPAVQVQVLPHHPVQVRQAVVLQLRRQPLLPPHPAQVQQQAVLQLQRQQVLQAQQQAVLRAQQPAVLQLRRQAVLLLPQLRAQALLQAQRLPKLLLLLLLQVQLQAQAVLQLPQQARRQLRPQALPQRRRQLQLPVTIGCSGSGTTTQAPGGQGGASVLYTFDNTPNDYFGNYNAAPYNSPQYVSPGYNGRGYAVRLLANQSQCLTVANYMNFYRRSLSVEAWIYPFTIYIASPYADTIIYAQTNSSTLYQYMWMMLRNGKNYGAFYGNDVTGPTVFQANQWQHIAFTYDLATTTQVVYVNGVADAVNANAPPCLITSGIQTIGCYPNAGGGFFHGYIDQLTILFGRAKTAAEILADATLVVYYSMDCVSSSSWDSGPNQINGLTSGLSSGDGGRVGQSYLFNTNSSYFQTTGLVLLGQSYSPFSLAMWLRPITSVTSGGTILHLSQYTDGTGWCVQFIGLSSSGQIVVHGYRSTGMVQVTGPVLVVGQWVHIVETYSQTNGIRLYVNGVLYGSSSPFVYSASGVPMTVTLGQHLSGSSCADGGILGGYYRGQIDEFYIYSRELSQADVTTLANP